MSEPLPGLAADDVAKLLTRDVKRDDGKDATAFTAQAQGLKAMRARVMEMDERLAVLEAQPPSQPFPL